MLTPLPFVKNIVGDASDTETSDTETSDTETSDMETSDTETSDTETLRKIVREGGCDVVSMPSGFSIKPQRSIAQRQCF